MKLIYCPHCGDLFKLPLGKPRYCECRRSAGMYTDQVYAIVGGYAISIGISNYSFNNALIHDDVFGGWKFGEHFPANHITRYGMAEFKRKVKEYRDGLSKAVEYTLEQRSEQDL